MIRLYGWSVYVNDMVVEHRWVFPKCRFTTFEKKDEGWARKLGYGHEETVPGCYLVGGDCLYIHPTIWAQLCRETDMVVEPDMKDVLVARPRRFERAQKTICDRAMRAVEKDFLDGVWNANFPDVARPTFYFEPGANSVGTWRFDKRVLLNSYA